MKKNRCQVIHYRSKCIGCNACVEADWNRWRISKKDGKAILIGSREKKGIFVAEVPQDEWDTLMQASNNCPVNIIHVKKL